MQHVQSLKRTDRPRAALTKVHDVLSCCCRGMRPPGTSVTDRVLALVMCSQTTTASRLATPTSRACAAGVRPVARCCQTPFIIETDRQRTQTVPLSKPEQNRRQLPRTVADAAAAIAELGAGAGAAAGPEVVPDPDAAVDPDGEPALEDGVLAVGEPPGALPGVPAGAVEGAPLGAVDGAIGAAEGTLLTAPAEAAVPLMGPDRPRG